ncbi:MAG TPA: hypothetical protein VGL09_08435 [Methylomirabilota bacterium]
MAPGAEPPAVGASRLIDQFMPRFDAVERHARTVAAPPAVVYAALWRADLGASPVVRLLMTLRALPAARRRPPGSDAAPLTLEHAIAARFIVLGQRPPHEVALGAIGRFWTAASKPVRVEPDGFVRFREAGYAKAVWDFTLTPHGNGATLLTTETRVWCADASSRRRFRLYWFLIRPFSGLIRRLMLRSIAREATRS